MSHLIYVYSPGAAAWRRGRSDPFGFNVAGLPIEDYAEDHPLRRENDGFGMIAFPYTHIVALWDRWPWDGQLMATAGDPHSRMASGAKFYPPDIILNGELTYEITRDEMVTWQCGPSSNANDFFLSGPSLAERSQEEQRSAMSIIADRALKNTSLLSQHPHVPTRGRQIAPKRPAIPYNYPKWER